jgi:hypothetical protein
VRSLEINLKYLSHDWHVQPVVKDPIALSALGGALGERRFSFTLRSPVLETFLTISHSLAQVIHNRATVSTLESVYFGDLIGLGVPRSTLRTSCGARDIADPSRFAAFYRASAKSRSFKLKIV